MIRGFAYTFVTWLALAQSLAAQPAPETRLAPAPPPTAPAPPPAAASSDPQPAAAATEPQPAAATEPAAPGMAGGRNELLRDRRAQHEAELAQSVEAARAQRAAIAAREEERAQRAIEARRSAPGYGVARFSIGAGVDSAFYDDAGYDLFDDDDVSARLGLWLGYDLVQLSSRATLAIDLGVGRESQEQSVWAGSIRTELDLTTVSAGVSLRYAALSWLDPQLRASGGASLLNFELAVDGRAYEDQLATPLATIGAGLFFHTPSLLFESPQGRFASFGVGLLIEGGYALRGATEPQLEADSDPYAIARTRASLGELGLSGPYVRTSVVARF